MNRILLMLILLSQGTQLWARNFRHYKGLSDQEVQAKADELDPDAILELGHRAKLAKKERLKQISTKRKPDAKTLKAALLPDGKTNKAIEKSIIDRHERSSRAARMALAKMGELGYVDEFIQGLKVETGTTKEESIEALGYIGDRKTAKELFELLSDDRMSDIPRSAHELGTAYSDIAEQALGEMFPEVLEDFRKKNPGRRFFFKEQWKKWWLQNKSKYP